MCGKQVPILLRHSFRWYQGGVIWLLYRVCISFCFFDVHGCSASGRWRSIIELFQRGMGRFHL